MASAMPPATIVLMPTICPYTSASGPPELPGASRTSACTQRRLHQTSRDGAHEAHWIPHRDDRRARLRFAVC
jgi:hypothetical protein